MSDFTLSIDGGAAFSAASAGVQMLRRQRYSMKTDTLTMALPRGLAGESLFAAGQWVQVWLDGEPFFYGRVPSTAYRLADAGSAQTVTLQCPWELFERWPALRDFNPSYAGANGIPAFLTSSLYLSQSWNLFSHNSFVSGICPTGYQILYALVAAEFMDDSTHFTIGEMPAGETPPNTEAVSGNLADIIRRCSRWTPHVGLWWDYETTPPTLRAMPAHEFTLSGGVNEYWVKIDRTLVSGPGSAPDRWELDYYVHTDVEAPVTIQLGASAELMAASATIREDMVPTALCVRSPSGASIWPSGATTNQPGAVWVERDTGTPPAALTEYLFKSMETARLEAQLVFAGGALRQDARPGRVWDFHGDDAVTGRGTALAWTQAVTDDLVTLTTTCELAHPRTLGAPELLSLTAWGRLIGG